MADVMSATAARIGIDWAYVDLDSIRLPPGETGGIPSDDEDIDQEVDSEFESGFGNIVVVDNLPVVPVEKFEKHKTVILQSYSQFVEVREDGFWVPLAPETQKTIVYCFNEFNTPPEAKLSREKTHGYKLERSHIFSVSMFDEFDRFMKVPDQWVPPETKPYTPRENLQHWLNDEKGRDQFVIRAHNDTEVLWNDGRKLKPVPVCKRQFWTESFVQWSPMGTYIATVHRQGAAVWGAATEFNRLIRYAHPQVRLIDFSPGE